MRRYFALLATITLMSFAGQASAQFAGTVGASMSGPTGASGPNTSSFFSSTMLGSRPQHPAPLNLNITNMLPSWQHFQNTMLLRNVFNGPQMTVIVPQQVPPKKK